MRKRHVKKLWRNPDALRRYGLDRSRGSRKLRRGRRRILARCPSCRDWSSLPMSRRLDLLEKELNKLMGVS